MAAPLGQPLPAPFQRGTAAPLHLRDQQQAQLPVLDQEAAREAQALGAAQAADMHLPDRPRYDLSRLFGMWGRPPGERKERVRARVEIQSRRGPRLGKRS